MKQKLESYRHKIEQIKEEKLGELKSLNVKPKYVSDLERFKIK
jgi:hypothetical protein